MIIETVAVGPLQANCHIIGDETTKKALVIDPGDELDRIVNAINKHGLKVEKIICTHGHFDHVGAAGELKKMLGGVLMLHEAEVETYKTAADMAAYWGFKVGEVLDPDEFAADGEQISIGGLNFKVMHTPGHSPGGICLYGEGIVLTGDTLFAGSVGRTDFPGGSMHKLKASFRRLMDLPDSTVVLSGHGPSTTIGVERTDNMFSHEFLG
ncbi:MAG: MBL fold metallo-hydrolase [Dissulfurispiraceae bacterium]|jgi:glyoxylase-like metal-dependent hydrolase (beta-lactamase superfamily II)|nr:MBL fold metallo-hydrolase [Dissulfurispiraceae bacterium]